MPQTEPIDFGPSLESFEAMPVRTSSSLTEAEVRRAEQRVDTGWLGPGRKFCARRLGDGLEAVPDRDLLERPDASAAPRPDHVVWG